MPWQPAAFLITATIISLPSLPAHAEPLSNSEYDRIMKEVDEQPGKQFIDGILGDIACGVACKPLGRLEPVCSIICGGITNIDWDKIPNPFVNQQPPKNSSDTSQVIHLDPVYIQVNPESKNAQHQPDTIFTPSGDVYDKTGTWSGIPEYSTPDHTDWVNSASGADLVFTPSGEVYERTDSY